MVQLAVGDRPGIHPRIQDRRDRPPELITRILRKRRLKRLFHQRLVFADNLLPVFGGQVGILRRAALFAFNLQDRFKVVMVDAENDIAIHLDEAAIGIIGEALPGRLCQGSDRLVVEAEIENGVHHARHGGAAARAHRDKQRVAAVAEPFAGRLRYGFQRLVKLPVQAVRIGSAIAVIGRAHFRGDRETRWHRQAEACHLGQIGALAAEQITQFR